MWRSAAVFVLIAMAALPGNKAAAADVSVAGAQHVLTLSPVSGLPSRESSTSLLAQPPAQVSAERSAQYRESSTVAALDAKTMLAAQRHQPAPAVQERRGVPAQREVSAYSFSFFDAGVSLVEDRDNDGYARSFSLRFDADVSSGSAKVYAKVYLRRYGESEWKWFYTTADFWINGNSDTDDFYIDASLNSGYATDLYDIAIDLYEVGYSGYVATISGDGSSSLRDIPLEERGLDLPLQDSGFSIGEVRTDLISDQDRDGYFSQFRVTFDPESAIGTQSAYAVLWVRAADGAWLREHTTGWFTIYGRGSDDRFSIEADWRSGYPTSHYDLLLEIYDASGMLVASASSERSDFAQLPLEDLVNDPAPAAPSKGGAGSSNVMLLMLGASALLWRRRQKTASCSR